MELSIEKAAKRFKVSKQGILEAIQRGKLPALVVTVTQLRVKPKDVQAYVATIPEWRQKAGRKGGLGRAAMLKARKEGRPWVTPVKTRSEQSAYLRAWRAKRRASSFADTVRSASP